MSKLSFRARQLDAYKTMPVYRSEEIPDVTDVAAINRAVPQMPTGMEKEEETEHHLQRALSAQQVYGTAEALVIPVPEIDDVQKQYSELHSTDYKIPKQYIHAQAFTADQEIPDYDMDSEDEAWVTEQSKKMEITPLKFEEMLDRLEKGSGQQVVTLPEAKLLLKEDDDLIITVFDYWLNKRLKFAHSLLPMVKSERRDGSSTNNPYVAFRRRTEKMQTRKNRKNDEVSYEKMLKLRRDLHRAVTVLEMVKKREKCKKELLQLSIEILDKRYEMEDFNGSNLAYAEAQKAPKVFYPLYDQYNKDAGGEVIGRKQKRKYEKRKHKSGSNQYQTSTEIDVMDYGSTEDEPISPGKSLSDQEDESNPDGVYAFRRKKYCNYHAPLETCGNWPWNSQRTGGHADKRFRYTLLSVDAGPETVRCIGYSRRRRGRGGRIIFDRAFAEQRADFWDRVVDADLPTDTDATIEQPDNVENSSSENTFQEYIKNNRWLHFTPFDDLSGSTDALFNGALIDLSSNELTDTLSDQIIDILPTGTEQSTVTPTQNFVPIVTAPNANTPDQLLHPCPAPQQTPPVVTTTNHINTKMEPVVPTVSSVSHTVSPVQEEKKYDIHHRDLIALKKDILDQSNRRRPSISSLVNPSSMVTYKPTKMSRLSSSPLESKKALFAVSALSNGSASVTSENGIHHLNGPTGQSEVTDTDTLNNSHGNTTSNLKKLNFPLTPSSDTSEATSSATVVDMITLNSVVADTNKCITAHSIISSNDKNLTDSAGLNSIPDVANTMEVT